MRNEGLAKDGNYTSLQLLIMNTPNANSLQVNTSYRQIIRIAWPISFAIFIPQITFVINNIFLGGLGESSLAAAGITGVYYLIFAVLGNGLNNGLQALIARRAGENRLDEIGKLFAGALFISLVIAVAGIITTWLISGPIMNLVLDSAEVKEKVISFLRIRIFGLPFLYIYQMRNALLVGTNQSKMLIAGTVAETACNIFFDYSLIYGHFGFPALGFNGAAIASILAEFTGMFVVFLVMHWRGVSKRFALYRHFAVNKPIVRLILQQSAPLIFQYAISIVSWIIFFVLVEHHGERALAISNSMRNLFGIFGVFSWAFASTCNMMVSNVIGQGKEDQVLMLIRKIARVSVCISLFVALLLNLFPALFLSVYGQGPEFIAEAIPVVRVVSSALVLMSFGTVWLNSVIGTGNSSVNLRIELAAITGYLIYVVITLKILFTNITIGWLSEWLYWLTMFGFSVMYMRSGKWKGKKI